MADNARENQATGISDAPPGNIPGGGVADHNRLISGHMTDQRATQVAGSLNRLTLSHFDESTWKRIEDSKEPRSFFPALWELARALQDFIGASPGSKWHDKRVEFERLISQLEYVKAYKQGYDSGVPRGLRQALGQNVESLATELAFVVPSISAIAEIYVGNPGNRPAGQQLRSALAPGTAAALDVYTSPAGTLGSRQSRQDLLKSTWIQGGLAAGKLLEDLERQGLLTTLNYTAASLVTALHQLGEKWIERFFTLNGRATEQGEYAGKMVGAACAEIIWAAANFIAFESAVRAFPVAFEGAEGIFQKASELALKQRVALLGQRAKSLLTWLETALKKDIPEIFYRAFVVKDPTGLERMLQFAGKLKGGNIVRRAQQLKGSFLFEELITWNAKYAGRVSEIEEFLRAVPEGIWQPKTYRARRLWVWQFSSYSKTAEWMELSDGALVVFPKPGVKSAFRMGLADIFESKSAKVVEKAAASPEFLAGQIGKNVERLDFDPRVYQTNQAVIRVEVEGLGVSGETTLVELKPGELWFSRQPPRVQQTPAGPKKLFGTYWTVVGPPDTEAATLARTAKKLEAAGFGSGDVWRHPITDSQAQKISEAVLNFVEKEKK